MQPPKTRKRRVCVNCMAIAVAFFAIIGATDYIKVRGFLTWTCTARKPICPASPRYSQTRKLHGASMLRPRL